MRHKRGAWGGFTLIEMTLTVTIAGILLGLGVPAFNQFIARTSQSRALEDVYTTMSIARNTAMVTGTPVVVCPSADGTACGGDWDENWLAFRDCNDDGAYDSSATTPGCDDDNDGTTEPEPRMSNVPFPTDLTISVEDTGNNTPTSLRFSPTGRVTSIVSVDPVTITIMHGDTQDREVDLCSNGRTYFIDPDGSTTTGC
jgi:type IV fimbrial biogenesis protein FimT